MQRRGRGATAQWLQPNELNLSKLLHHRPIRLEIAAFLYNECSFFNGKGET
ncbi:hypothetical protein A8990_11666 [Paenibacillus taihuensis]|uniref:Uncharacterized protein n=1 Tax=Paenibacillus taihuensis TaxID=1156355 RepID=A0A3D9RVK4_9BACL|nr:hypothetical protein A8990_11666 [Paenibacillus taihuensis]